MGCVFGCIIWKLRPSIIILVPAPTRTGHDNAPVTLDLNGQVVIRAQGPDEERVTGLVLSRSQSTGKAMRLVANWHFLGRAVELGFRRVEIVKPDVPVVGQGKDETTGQSVPYRGGRRSSGTARTKSHRFLASPSSPCASGAASAVSTPKKGATAGASTSRGWSRTRNCCGSSGKDSYQARRILDPRPQCQPNVSQWLLPNCYHLGRV
jgi:hypothetical protein